MANIEISEKPDFVTEIQKLESTTPAHADHFNEIYAKLLENEVYLKEHKANKTVRREASLLASNWTGNIAPYSYTLELEEATESNIIEILPPTNLSMEQYEAMTEAGIVGGSQSVGKITLLAYGEKPTIDLPIQILVRGD